MTPRCILVTALAVLAVTGCASAPGESPASRRSARAVATLGDGFRSNTARVNGTTLHYVRGGTGAAVILVHGFPQDWYEFHRIMPRLAKTFTVIAVDLRGVGRSAATPDGYDAANMAEDLHQLVRQLALDPVYVVGHDIGGMVAYAFARLYPRLTRGVMVLDVPLPGIEPWEEIKGDPLLWHIAFHQTPGLPEKLLAGRQGVYFRDMFDRALLDRNAISDADVAHYADSYAAPEQLRAGLEYYRAFPANERFGAGHRRAIEVPLVLAGGDNGFGRLMPRVAAGVRARGWTSVTIEIIRNSGHYVVDEQPGSMAELIERYASP